MLAVVCNNDTHVNILIILVSMCVLYSVPLATKSQRTLSLYHGLMSSSFSLCLFLFHYIQLAFYICLCPYLQAHIDLVDFNPVDEGAYLEGGPAVEGGGAPHHHRLILRRLLDCLVILIHYIDLGNHLECSLTTTLRTIIMC